MRRAHRAVSDVPATTEVCPPGGTPLARHVVSERHQFQCPAAKEAAETLLTRSPTSLKVTLATYAEPTGSAPWDGSWTRSTASPAWH
jgi:hypothetical protein